MEFKKATCTRCKDHEDCKHDLNPGRFCELTEKEEAKIFSDMVEEIENIRRDLNIEENEFRFKFTRCRFCEHEECKHGYKHPENRYYCELTEEEKEELNSRVYYENHA